VYLFLKDNFHLTTTGGTSTSAARSTAEPGQVLDHLLLW